MKNGSTAARLAGSGNPARTTCTPNSHFIHVILVLLVALGLSHAAFTRSFLTIQMHINEEGGAEVINELRFFMNDTDSVDLYRLSLRTTNDLGGWRDRMGLNDIRFYTDISRAPIENMRVQALAPDTCNVERTACYGTLIYSYTVKPPTNVSGMINVTKYAKPRVVEYRLIPFMLSFELSPVGEPYLAERTAVEITLPSDSINVKMSPQPTEYENEIPRGAYKLTWQGRVSLANAELSFERKESLMSEVINFFDSIQKTLLEWITSREGMVLGAVIILIGVAYFLLERRKSEGE